MGTVISLLRSSFKSCPIWGSVSFMNHSASDKTKSYLSCDCVMLEFADVWDSGFQSLHSQSSQFEWSRERMQGLSATNAASLHVFYDDSTTTFLHCTSFSVHLLLLGGFLFSKISEFPIGHAAKLFPLLHWFQNCFCFCSTTFPSHVGTFFGLQWRYQWENGKKSFFGNKIW